MVLHLQYLFRAKEAVHLFVYLFSSRDGDVEDFYLHGLKVWIFIAISRSVGPVE